MTRIDANSASVVKQAKQLILKENLLTTGDSVLVGLSGGADSVALVLVLLELQKEYKLQISCAHINHCLRGDDARRDMEFVQAFCNRLKLPLFVLEEDVGRYAKEHRLSLEDAGRQIRYCFFREHKTDKIATAHTRDDNAETVLMNLIKGNLPKGILPQRENIIRPLLGVTKGEIYAYLKEKNQPFVTDETNFSTDYTRNRIRLELIPYLEEHFNKNFTNTIYNTTDIYHQEQAFLEELCQKFLSEHAQETEEGISLMLAPLQEAHPALGKKVLRRAYFTASGGDGRISYEQLDKLWKLCRQGQSGQRLSLSASMEALRCTDRLIVSKKTEPVAFFEKLEEDIPCHLPFGQQILLSKEPKTDGKYCYPITVMPGNEVWVRNRKQGDKLYFQNSGIHKKLSDFFTDKKIPLPQRERIPLVTVNDTVRIVAGHFYEQPRKEDFAYQFYITIK